MGEALLGFGDALQPLNVAFIVLGVLMGYVIGVLPGLNRPAALAIAVPLSYYMTPLSAVAFLIGIGMGLVMLLADYWPALLSRTPLNTSYSTSTFDAVGFLFGMLITGFAEETIFRGLLVGFLVVLVPGRLRIGAVDLPVAAYIVALLFALAHWQTFLVDPIHQAIAQQTYAFLWGLAYVWLMERSKSLLAPIVAHGVGYFTEVGLVILLTAAWA